jgi:hypothetical protein
MNSIDLKGTLGYGHGRLTSEPWVVAVECHRMIGISNDCLLVDCVMAEGSANLRVILSNYG